MKLDTHYISIVCPEVSDIQAREKIIRKHFPRITGIEILGNELLIPAEQPETGYPLKDIRAAVAPARLDMFHYDLDDNGQPCRWWYCC